MNFKIFMKNQKLIDFSKNFPQFLLVFPQIEIVKNNNNSKNQLHFNIAFIQIQA